MPKVSIIVPVYNVEKYLDKCLNSLVNQTFKDIEILVINDGSTDNSQAIIDKYQAQYPELLSSFLKENGGQGSARNLGLEYAKGDYISFVDSDDWLDLDFIEKSYNSAIKNNSDIVICDMFDFCDDGTKKFYNCTKYNSVYEVTPSASNKIFKKSFIGSLKFIPDKWYEDFDFTTKLLFNNPTISVVSDTFYNCNVRINSTMNNNNSLKNLDMIYVLDDLKQYAINNNLYNENIIKYLIFDHILITTINRVNNQHSKNKKEVLNKLTEYCRNNLNNYKALHFYQNVKLGRKIIANLNYMKLYKLSHLLLNIKAHI